jgi:hypothetical protein
MPKFTVGNEFEKSHGKANDHEPEVLALDHEHGWRHVVAMAERGSIGGSRIAYHRHAGVIHAGVHHDLAGVTPVRLGKAHARASDPMHGEGAHYRRDRGRD